MTYCHDVKYEYISTKSVISKSYLPDLDYAFNPYIGCYHGCLYCYARDYLPTKYSNIKENWGCLIFIKRNAIEVLKRELKRLRPGVIGVSTITDPYQPIEANVLITKKAIEYMLKLGFKVSIQTKSDLILRDLETLVKYSDRVDVGITITSVDNTSFMKYLEPKAPQPTRRVNTLVKLSSEGIETWIFYGPVIPTINDDDETIRDIVEVAVSTNSKILVDRLRVRAWMKETLSKVLHQDEVVKILTKARSRKWWRTFVEKVLNECKRHKVKCIPALAEPEENRSNVLDLNKFVRSTVTTNDH